MTSDSQTAPETHKGTIQQAERKYTADRCCLALHLSLHHFGLQNTISTSTAHSMLQTAQEGRPALWVLVPV